MLICIGAVLKINRIFWGQANRLRVIGNRFPKVFDIKECMATLVVIVRVVGFQPDGFAELCNGIFVAIFVQNPGLALSGPRSRVVFAAASWPLICLKAATRKMPVIGVAADLSIVIVLCRHLTTPRGA